MEKAVSTWNWAFPSGAGWRSRSPYDRGGFPGRHDAIRCHMEAMDQIPVPDGGNQRGQLEMAGTYQGLLELVHNIPRKVEASDIACYSSLALP